jgi:hypothetical protein
VGQRLSQIPIDRSERVLGFVNDTPFVVVQPRSPTVSMTLKVFDGRTGWLSHEVQFDSRWPMLTDSACRSHGVVFARGRGKSNAGFGVVDLATGRWKMLSEMMVLDVAVHPKRPWVAFRESARPIDKPRRLVVVDFRTGDEVFLRPEDPEYVSLGAPLFVGESDRLVAPVTRPATEPGADDKNDAEVWRMASPAIREKVVRNVRIGWQPHTATGGRIAWTTFGPTRYHVDVYDLDAERVIFSTPQIGRDPNSRYAIDIRLRLSSTGRALMSDPLWLWNVETSEPIWYSKNGLWSSVIDGEELFEVEELWEELQRFPTLRLGEWRTNAFYNLDAASLQFRCWSADAPVLEFTNADFSLGVTSQGVVHRLPFRVNWPLLALCQMILALPLLLVWLILHRRPRRSLREITP